MWSVEICLSAYIFSLRTETLLLADYFPFQNLYYHPLNKMKNKWNKINQVVRKHISMIVFLTRQIKWEHLNIIRNYGFIWFVPILQPYTPAMWWIIYSVASSIRWTAIIRYWHCRLDKMTSFKYFLIGFNIILIIQFFDCCGECACLYIAKI